MTRVEDAARDYFEACDQNRPPQTRQQFEIATSHVLAMRERLRALVMDNDQEARDEAWIDTLEPLEDR